MWGRNKRSDNPGELNKADIEYAVRKFLHDAHDYAEHGGIQTYQGCDDPVHGIRGGTVV
jgi:hypothetical protein